MGVKVDIRSIRGWGRREIGWLSVGRFVVALQRRRVEGVRIARMPGRESEKEQVPRAYVSQ